MKMLFRWPLAAVLLSVMYGGAAAQTRVETESFMLQSTDPSAKIYVRNKRPADVAKFDEDRIVIFVHGATYPSEVAFDFNLPGGSWMDFVAQRGYDAYLLDVRGYGRSTRPRSSRGIASRVQCPCHPRSHHHDHRPDDHCDHYRNYRP